MNNTRVNPKYGFDLRVEIDTPPDGSRRGYSKTGLEKTNRRILAEKGGEAGIQKIELKITIRDKTEFRTVKPIESGGIRDD